MFGMLAPRDRAGLVGPIADGDCLAVRVADMVDAAIAGLLGGERVHRRGGYRIALGVFPRARGDEQDGGLPGAILCHGRWD